MEATVEPVAAESRAARRGAVVDRLGANGLLVTIVLAPAALSALVANRLISTDGWLALVAGRLIADRGLPSTNTLTLTGEGRPWVDQQWLAQLALYGAERLGGLRLVLLGHLTLTFAAFAAATIVARRRGASPDAVATVAIVALIPFALSTFNVRTQSLVYVLFAALLAVVTLRAPLRWRQTLLLVAILVAWANLHGSVLVAAALVSLRGILEFRARRDAQAWVLAVIPWACAFASPYARELPSYYADTILNPGFGHLAQWQPTTLSAISAPLFALVFGFVWVLARHGAAYSLYEKLAGGALLVLALLAIRNWVWFTLFALMLLPRAITRARTASRSVGVERVNAALGLLTGAALLAAVAVTIARPASWFEAAFPRAAADTVAAIARERPEASVYATEGYADWLLWKVPALEGRLAYDARFELLERDELEAIALFRASPLFLRETLRRHEIVVLDRRTEHRVVPALSRQTVTLFQGRRIIVAAKP